MITRNNYTTILLIIIITILLMGLGVAIYYVLDLDWFSKQPIDIYNENSNVQVKVEKEIKYDIQKRTYNIQLTTQDFKIIVYKDGSVGITMLTDENNKIPSQNMLLNTEVKASVNNIIRVYEVEIGKMAQVSKHIVLLDADGNLYKLDMQELMASAKYVFNKIEGLAYIVDVRQITNEGLVNNIEGVNAIAIDKNSNEILLTDYLIKSIEQ